MSFSSPAPSWKFLSSPLEILKALPHELSTGTLFLATTQTITHCLIAFLIAWFIGLLFAWVLISSQSLQQILVPIIQGVSGIPPVMLLPLLLIAFGLEAGSVIALAVFGAVLSIVQICYEAQSGLARTEFKLMILDLGYSGLATWLWELSTISDRLYTAAGEGLRWSLILSVIGEMHGSVAGGLGAYVDSGRLNQNYAGVYIGIISCAILSFILRTALNWTGKIIHTVIKKALLGKALTSRLVTH